MEPLRSTLRSQLGCSPSLRRQQLHLEHHPLNTETAVPEQKPKKKAKKAADSGTEPGSREGSRARSEPKDSSGGLGGLKSLMSE